jgi:hypothetical protein
MPQGVAAPWGLVVSADFATALGGLADCLRDSPALPVSSTPLLSLQAGSGHLHSQHFARVSNEKLPGPLGEIGPSLRHRVLGLEGAEQRAELGLGKANKQPLSSGMGQWRSSRSRHHFMISVSRSRRQAADLVGARCQKPRAGAPFASRHPSSWTAFAFLELPRFPSLWGRGRFAAPLFLSRDLDPPWAPAAHEAPPGSRSGHKIQTTPRPRS